LFLSASTLSNIASVWSTIYVMIIQSSKLDDAIIRTKLSPLHWTIDSRSIFCATCAGAFDNNFTSSIENKKDQTKYDRVRYTDKVDRIFLFFIENITLVYESYFLIHVKSVLYLHDIKTGQQLTQI